MNLIKSITAAAVVAVGATALATPAGAVITTFASYSPIGTGANVRFVNNGSTSANGSGGSFYTTATSTGTVPAANTVKFSFLQAGISSVINNIDAAFTLSATVTNTPAVLQSGFLIQEGLNGTFSFRTTQAYTVGNTTYAAGSNLLSAVFTDGAIVGQRGGTSGSFTASTAAGDSVVYTSDFLTFPNPTQVDFAISLTSIQSVLQAAPTTGTPNRALRTFRGVSSGTFSVDPAPLINALVPEPAIWGMMILGFGLVGASMRVRRRQTVSA